MGLRAPGHPLFRLRCCEGIGELSDQHSGYATAFGWNRSAANSSGQDTGGIARWITPLRRTGLVRGIAATGRVIGTQELVIYRTAEGKIVESWSDLRLTVRDELTWGTTVTGRHF
jgi:hypothetical protein